MKQILITISFVILCITLVKAATNVTNSTNTSLPTNSSSNNTTPLTTLYIGAFFDLTKKDGYGSLPMAQQAIEEINNNSGVLPGYRLELVVKSTQGSFGIGQKVFNEFLNTGPRKLMLLGPEEDSLAKSIAAYSAIPDVNLLQFSYGTNDLELANRRDLYPNFFRTTTSAASLDEPRIKFIKEYGWDEVGIIYGDSVQYLKLSNQLAGRLKQNNIKVLAEVRLQANDPKRAIRTLKDRGIHVILGMFSLDSVARNMICEARRERMYGPHYVWIFTNSNNNGWWIPRKGENIACSDLEMKCQVQNHFSFYHTNVILPKGSFYDYANKNRSQIIADYRARVDSHNDTSNRSSLYLHVYDAVWSIAFVLDKSRAEIEGQGKTLENLTYGDANATNVFRTETVKLNFKSPSIGTKVRYYPNGDRRNGIVIKQIVIKDGSFTMLNGGKFDVDKNVFTASSDIHWFAGTPYTKTTETYIYRTIDKTLFIAVIVVAALGILYALFCLLTLVLNFKKKIVRNSGPVISLIIILGCLLNYVTVILYGFDYSRVSPDDVTRLCRARSWTFAIGFTLSVGGLAAKLWMAYSVLKERFVRSRNVMMFWMLGILALLLIIDITILACWETRDPLYRILKQVRSQPEYECFQPITADTFRAKIEVVEHCDCADLTLWLVVILAFKALIVVTGGFLAWQTRRLYIPALNDTQHCVSCMFVVVMFCVVGVIVAFTATLYPSVYYGVIGGLTIFATTMILVLLFTNKFVRLSCKRGRSKTIVTGQLTETNTTCACGATCAKFCSCCACSSACCISFWSCFPCCNLYTCLRSFFCGSQVHPASSDGRESKSDFYIGGVLQDKDAEIVYLKNELREKDTLLSNVGQKRTVKSNGTQTYDGGSNFLDHGDDAYDSTVDASGSDAESLTSSDGRRRFRRAANKIRIFSEGADYSHVRSKVDTGMRSSLAPGIPQERRGSRMSISSLSNEELRKLKTTIAEKDDEITRLRKELEAVRKRGATGNSSKISTSEQKPGETSPRTQRILLIETPATPIPEERTQLTTSAVQSSGSPGPTAVKTSGSPSPTAVKTSGSPSPTAVKTSGSPSPTAAIISGSPSPTAVKTSGSPSSTAVKISRSTSLSDAKSSGSVKLSGSPSPSAVQSSGLPSSSAVKSSASPSPSAAKSSASPSPSAAKSSGSSSPQTVQASGSPSPFKRNSNDSEMSSSGVETTSGKPTNQAKTQDRTNKKNSVGPGGAWLFDDQPGPTKEDEKPSNEPTRGSAESAAADRKKATPRDSNTTPTTKNSTEDYQKASLTNVAISVHQDKQSAPKNRTNDTTKEDTDGKKEPVHRKISSWLFGNDKNKDAGKNNTQEDENRKNMDDKDNDKNKQVDESAKREDKTAKNMDGQGNKDNEQTKLAGESNILENKNREIMDQQGDKNSNKNANTGENKDKEDRNGKRRDDKGNNDLDSGNGMSNNAEGLSSDNTKLKGELAKDANTAKEVNRPEGDAVKEDDSQRSIEMIDEEDEDNDDDDDDDYDGEDDEDDGNGDKEGAATGAAGGARKNKRRGRRKKLGYGKLKWNAASKIDTGSGSYAPRKSVKKIPHFKNDYSHVRSRLSSVSEGSTSEKATEIPTTQRKRSDSENDVKRNRSVSLSKNPLPSYSNVRPRLYNGARRYNSEMPSTMPNNV